MMLLGKKYKYAAENNSFFGAGVKRCYETPMPAKKFICKQCLHQYPFHWFYFFGNIGFTQHFF